MENMQRRETIASELDIKVMRMTNGKMRVRSSMGLNFEKESIIYLLAPALKNTSNFKVIMAYTEEEYSKPTFKNDVITLVEKIASGIFVSGSSLLFNGEIILPQNTMVFEEIESTTNYRYFITLSQTTDTIYLTEVDSNDGSIMDHKIVGIGDIGGVTSCTTENMPLVSNIVRTFIEDAKELIHGIKSYIEDIREVNSTITTNDTYNIYEETKDTLGEWYSKSNIVCKFKTDEDGFENFNLFNLIFRIWKSIDPSITEYTYGPRVANDNLIVVEVDDDSDWEDVYKHSIFVIDLPYTETLINTVKTNGEVNLKDIYVYTEALVAEYSRNILEDIDKPIVPTGVADDEEEYDEYEDEE